MRGSLRASLLLALAAAFAVWLFLHPSDGTRRASFERSQPHGTIESPAGPVEIDAPPYSKAPMDLLFAAALRARREEIRIPGGEAWRFVDSPVLGWHLRTRSGRVLVTPVAALRASAVAPRDIRSERRTLSERLVPLLAAAHASENRLVGLALARTLGCVLEADGNPDSEELNAGLARRILANGWLARVAPFLDVRARTAFLEALARTMRLLPTDGWAGDGWEYEKVSDAWGAGGEVLRCPDRTVFSMIPPIPMDDSDRMHALGACRIVVELPAGTDPAGRPASVSLATGVRLWSHGRALASWSRERGFHADASAWRVVFPGLHGVYLRDEFPPHVPLVGLDGSLAGLAVPAGVLRPPENGSAEEAHRFLDDAARLLPDAAHLDLLQQYFLKWVYDSPDPTDPLLIGCPEAQGDIHQTAEQIVATVAGGVCRGDCDDFAEMGVTVVRRQGHLAHVMSLPSHLAAAWALPSDDGWDFYVLQSGPTLHFRGPDLTEVVQRAYEHYEGVAPLDPNAVPVALRFGQENTRSASVLSWRIFQDRDYSRTLVDVQGNWHECTYAQGIRKMLRLIASGDRDCANWMEIAGLYEATGQYEKAIVCTGRALAATRDPDGRRHERLQLVGLLLEAGRKEEARALAEDILEKDVRGASDLGLADVHVAVDLASRLLRGGAAHEAADVLSRTSRWRLDDPSGKLEELLRLSAHDERLGGGYAGDAVRSTLRSYVAVCLEVLAKLDAGAGSATLEARVADWSTHMALGDVEEPEDALRRWGAYGRWQLVTKGEAFLRQVEEAPFPDSADRDLERLASDPSTLPVRSWVRASPFFFQGVLDRIASNHHEAPDPERVRRIAGDLEESVGAARRLGLAGSDAEEAAEDGALQAALLLHDLPAVRAAFRHVHELGDRDTRERAVDLLVRTAAHLDAATWHEVMQAWSEEVDDRPEYFEIAWGALLHDAPAQALEVAGLAAKRFGDDPAFRAEAAFLHERSRFERDRAKENPTPR